MIAGAGGGVISSFSGDGVGSSGGNAESPASDSGDAAGVGEDMALGLKSSVARVC